MVTTDKFEDRVAITGIGMSDDRSAADAPVDHAHDGRLAGAIEDAGLTVRHRRARDLAGRGAGATGISEGGIGPVANALGIRPTWHNGSMETPGHSGAVVAAMLAVASGLCRHVLCYRTVWESTATELMRSGRLAPPAAGRVDGDFQWRLPFGAPSAANWIAMYASQYFHVSVATARCSGGSRSTRARTRRATPPRSTATR